MDTEPEEYSGFKTRGTDIDDAYSTDEWELESDADELDYEKDE